MKKKLIRRDHISTHERYECIHDDEPILYRCHGISWTMVTYQKHNIFLPSVNGKLINNITEQITMTKRNIIVDQKKTKNKTKLLFSIITSIKWFCQDWSSRKLLHQPVKPQWNKRDIRIHNIVCLTHYQIFVYKTCIECWLPS